MVATVLLLQSALLANVSNIISDYVNSQLSRKNACLLYISSRDKLEEIKCNVSCKYFLAVILHLGKKVIWKLSRIRMGMIWSKSRIGRNNFKEPGHLKKSFIQKTISKAQANTITTIISSNNYQDRSTFDWWWWQWQWHTNMISSCWIQQIWDYKK